jgi:hypothetical protein
MTLFIARGGRNSALSKRRMKSAPVSVSDATESGSLMEPHSYGTSIDASILTGYYPNQRYPVSF